MDREQQPVTTRAPHPRTMTGLQLDDAEELLSSLRGQLPRLRGAMAAGDGATVTETLGALRDVLRRLAHAARDIGAILPGEAPRVSTIEDIEHCFTIEDLGADIGPSIAQMPEAPALDVWMLVGGFDLGAGKRLRLWARSTPVTTRTR